jgi:hypothetical protein
VVRVEVDKMGRTKIVVTVEEVRRVDDELLGRADEKADVLLEQADTEELLE